MAETKRVRDLMAAAQEEIRTETERDRLNQLKHRWREVQAAKLVLKKLEDQFQRLLDEPIEKAMALDPPG